MNPPPNEIPGSGIEERAGQPRECLRSGFHTGGRVAGGENHPVGGELELRRLARCEQAVVEIGRLLRDGERQHSEAL
jgi:hypothetical protein